MLDSWVVKAVYLNCDLNQLISLLVGVCRTTVNWHVSLHRVYGRHGKRGSGSWAEWDQLCLEELYWRRNVEKVDVNEGARCPRVRRGSDGSRCAGSGVMTDLDPEDSWCSLEKERYRSTVTAVSLESLTRRPAQASSRSSVHFLLGLKHRSIVSPAEDLCVNLNCCQLPDTLSVWAILSREVFFSNCRQRLPDL